MAACIAKMHSPPHEISQFAGVDEFSKGVPEIKKKRGRARGRRRKSENVGGAGAGVGR